MALIGGILMIASYCLMVYYLFRGGSIFAGLSLTGLFWVIVAGMPFNTILNEMFQSVVEKNAATILLMILGSWLGQVLVQTGIVATIIRKAVELGGDRPLIVAMLIALATGFLFTGMYGVGGAIAVGVIALPILMSLGIPPWLATASFTTAIGAAMNVNIVDINNMLNIFLIAGTPKNAIPIDRWLQYAFIFFALYTLSNLAMLTYYLKFRGAGRTYSAAQTAEVLPKAQAPWYSLITPVIPMIVILTLKWPPVPAFVLTILLALLTTGKFRRGAEGVEILQKTFRDGTAEIAGVILAWLGIIMFVTAASKATSVLQPLLAPILPQSTLGLALFYGLLAPLALYRGPLMGGGAGAALVAFFVAAGKLPLLMLFAAVRIVNSYGNATCPTQSWTIWVIHYTQVPGDQFVRTHWVFNWVGALAGCLVAYFVFGH